MVDIHLGNSVYDKIFLSFGLDVRWWHHSRYLPLLRVHDYSPYKIIWCSFLPFVYVGGPCHHSYESLYELVLYTEQCSACAINIIIIICWCDVSITCNEPRHCHVYRIRVLVVCFLPHSTEETHYLILYRDFQERCPSQAGKPHKTPGN